VTYYRDDWLTVMLGDCREVMASMEPESVHCVVTSPPYWGLRDYGSPGQLGLEPTPEAYVESMVAVFREVRRVLRSDGTVWLNLGDSYGSGNSGQRVRNNNGGFGGTDGGMTQSATKANPGTSPVPGMSKQLMGIPWRVAFALQADGWYLRSDVIWSKPNPMPESVTDRPTKSHEYLFLLSKSPRYYFDADAVREPSLDAYGGGTPVGAGRHDGPSFSGKPTEYERGTGRNIRSVWTIATQPYPGAHFATFPQALVEPCIKAGTSERGVCPECGAPWRRVTETTTIPQRVGDWKATGETHRNDIDRKGGFYPDTRTLTWIRSCTHEGEPIGGVVLDPFAGSGTVGLVAQRLSRRAVLIDLNADYLGQVMDRNRDIPLGLGA
jgi:DNA modification methylase